LKTNFEGVGFEEAKESRPAWRWTMSLELIRRYLDSWGGRIIGFQDQRIPDRNRLKVFTHLDIQYSLVRAVRDSSD
jgi:hypothetical protein